MKKRSFISAVVFIILALCSIGLVACTKKDEEHGAHNWGKWVTDGGIMHIRTCECGEIETKYHNWDSGTITKEASCIETGVLTYACAECGETKTETIEITTVHDFGKWISDNNNTHTRACTACGEIETKNHNWDSGTITKEASCLETGVLTYACAECGETKTETIEIMTAHDFGKWISDNNNTHTRACIACGENETESHNLFGETCKECGFSYMLATIIGVDNAKIDYVNSSIEMFMDKNTFNVNLSNMIKVSPNSVWKLYGADNTLIPTKFAVLQDGENSFLIVVSSTDGLCDNTYKLKIYKSFEVSVKYYGVYNEVLKTVTVDSGYKYAIDYSPEIVGYTFNYWKLNDEQLTEIMPYGNVNLYADCTANIYTVNLNPDGGTVAKKTNSVTFDSNYTLPVPTKMGYTFVGWYDGETKITGNNGESLNISKLSKNSEILAKWQVNSYCLQVEYDSYSHGLVSGGGTYDYDTSVTVTATKKLGYNFIGWYNGENLLDGSVNYTFSMPAENVTYTAKWELDKRLSNINFASTTTTCAITDVKDKTVKEIEIPEYVTSISQGAFSGCANLESITLPFVGDSITNANDNNQYPRYPFGYIFGESSYTGGNGTEQYYFESSTSSATYATYYIPSTLISVTITGGNIFHSAFRNCRGLASIKIGNGVTSIDYAAFCDCRGLTSVEIPDSVTKIGDSAFVGCNGLTSITIPDSVTSIGERAFYDCSGLTRVEIGNGVTSIGNNAFCNCRGLTRITVDSENTKYHSGGNCLIETNSKTLIVGCRASDIPTDGSITTIGDDAFSYCSGLTNITIPDSVTTIGDDSFSYCSGLTSITIPDSVTSIGEHAFYSCSGLTIYCETTSKPSGWAGGWISYGLSGSCPVVWNCNNNEVADDGCIYGISGGTRFSLKDNIATVVRQSTAICGDIVIPDGVNYKGITYSVTSIGGSAFRNCSGLTSITIPDSVTSISGGAFSGCSGLTSITIPDSVTSIGGEAFYGCGGLKGIEFNGTMIDWKYISKALGWDRGMHYFIVITCTDGKLDKNGNKLR